MCVGLKHSEAVGPLLLLRLTNRNLTERRERNIFRVLGYVGSLELGAR